MPRSLELKLPKAERKEWMENFEDYKQQGRLNTVTLVSNDGVKHEAHRSMMLDASDELAGLTGNPLFKQGQEMEVDMSSGALHALLDFVHYGSSTVSIRCACEVLHASHAYNLEKLENCVIEAMERHLDASTAVDLLEESGLIGLKSVERVCEQHVVRHFERCAQTEGFTRMDWQVLRRIIRSPDLQVSSEQAVANAVNVWRKAGEKRNAQANFLLKEHWRGYYDNMLCEVDRSGNAVKRKKSKSRPTTS
eukprot:gnl/TRDRNA2_/TRDRNA2_199223_c0_seq1.p1 gnl/TRDRNA2_/TRDRNA2_199223_c0~~gnl/TRDRNA2_/TRDRNA2_199223_c0_seq1.p1  ORF type:complete len:250 (+),score=45.69 gnl/TRDRNA2_/TRDRNA2_199223_c0_seq1:139-888(+)